MFSFPKTTEFNKRIPKQMFYEKMSVTPALKKIFVEQIKNIIWTNKIAKSTINLKEGQAVKEIQIIKLSLHSDKFDTSVLRHIDKAIPYHNIYVLDFEEKYQVWLKYKDADGSLTKYFNTEWLSADELPLKIDGLNLDAVYENFIIQISGIQKDTSSTLSEQIKTTEQIEKLKKEIARLDKQARVEKQPKKAFELSQKINELKQKLSLIDIADEKPVKKETNIEAPTIEKVETVTEGKPSQTVKALSILPEFAADIFDGFKTVEWRSWKTDYRGDLLICASSRKLKGCISGHALCMVTLKDVVPFTRKHLNGALMDFVPNPAGYAWLLENVRLIKPFPYKGKLHIYDVDASLVEVLSPIGTKQADDEFEKYYKQLVIDAGGEF